jgi:hypothetical protein
MKGQFNVFLVSVKSFATAPGSLKRRDGAWVNWFNWRTFWTFVLHCDVTKTRNSTIFKLKSCVLNVSYSWWVKRYVIKVLVVECNVSIDRRITYFDTYVYMNFSDIKNCWCLYTYFRCTLYTTSFLLPCMLYAAFSWTYPLVCLSQKTAYAPRRISLRITIGICLTSLAATPTHHVAPRKTAYPTWIDPITMTHHSLRAFTCIQIMYLPAGR